ncbi:MAG: LacI family DNA-binding transcriptional regulator [Chloroflexota bacterium]
MGNSSGMSGRKKRVSSRDVAGAAGVSVNTVSLVMRDSPLVAPATKARVREVIDRLGYQPSRASAGPGT